MKDLIIIKLGGGLIAPKNWKSNKANIKVAILCNHQKKVTKSFDSMMEKINDRIRIMKNRINVLRKRKVSMKSHKMVNKAIGRLKERIKNIKVDKKTKTTLKIQEDRLNLQMKISSDTS